MAEPRSAAPGPAESLAPVGRAARWCAAGGWMVVGLVVAVACVRLAGSGWRASGDGATNILRIRDVGGPHTPLVGPYSRYGFQHPGPYYFYLLAPLYRLTGARDGSLLATALAVNLAAIGFAVFLGRRIRGTRGLLAVLLPVALLARALGSEFLTDPWNPHITVVLAFTFLISTWALSCGWRWGFVSSLALAAFLVGTHVGYVFITAVPLLVATVSGLAPGRNRRERLRQTLWLHRGPRRAALAVAALALLPILVNQFAGSGNLSDMWTLFRHPTADRAGFGFAWRYLRSETALAPPWLHGHEARDIFSGAVVPRPGVPVLLVALVTVTVVAVRRHDRIATRACVLALSVWCAAFVAVASVVGPPYDYLLRWSWAVSAFSVFAISSALLPIVGLRVAARHLRWWRIAAISCAALLIGTIAALASRATPPQAYFSRAVATMTPRIVEALGPIDGTVFIRPAGGDATAYFYSGLILALEAEGYDVRTIAEAETGIGGHRIVRPHEPIGVELAIGTGVATDTLATDLGGTEIARYEEAAVSLSESEARRRLAVAGVTEADVARLVEFLEIIDGGDATPRITVVLVPH